MKLDNEKELEMNEYEKMSNKLIEEKEEVNFNFSNWLFRSFFCYNNFIYWDNNFNFYFYY